MSSVWEINTSENKRYPKLDRDINTSIAVIGGGICGILTAYLLKNKGIDCVVIESKEIGNGVTKNTTAKITSQHNLIYTDMVKQAGKDKASKYLKANEKAVNKYREMCSNIDCDFESLPSYVYSKDNILKIEKEVNTVNNLGLKVEFVNELDIPIKTMGAIKFNNQAQFNPLKFLNYISKDLEIYEHTEALSIDDNNIVTQSGRVKADSIIVTTHFPFIDKYGFYFLKMYQQRSYVLALGGCKKIDGMYIDEKENGLSFRGYNDLILLGGCGHRTGEQGGGYKDLREKAKEIYPDSKELYSWATQDCITIDGIPYIGKYTKKYDNIFVATGFNKWGMTSSMVSAEILSDMVLGKKNEYEEVFCPQRFSANNKFFIHVGKTLKNFIYPSTKRCAHLGCTLKYNKQEHSWDCPCHGSRFSEEGELINNPAKKGLNED